MNNELLVSTLGRSWAFPLRFSNDKGVAMVEGTDAVLQSLKMLFMTATGERIMREAWGSAMNEFIFENITDELVARLQNHIEEIILRHEPRVMVQDVDIQPSEQQASRLLVQITFMLSGSNMSGNLDFTLDLNDGQTLRLL